MFTIIPCEIAHADDAKIQEQSVAFSNDEGSGTYDTDKTYTLGGDDEIKITVFGEADLSGTYRLSGTGAVSIPLIGEVALNGLTLREAEELIKGKLVDGYLVDPSVSIEVLKYRPFYILGEVRAPGSYSYVSDMNVLNAVALAGGFTYRANQKAVKILKKNEGESGEYEEFPVKTKISPGDVIVVKERFF